MKLKFDNIRKSFVHVFGGSVLTENFFLRNMRFILVIVLIMFLFISHRYAVLQKMSEIEHLERVLKDARYESLTISSSLTEASRQGEIERRVEEAGLELKVTNEPVYHIGK
ncbi:MAG: FtsL-like putative cell division protein, partial [Proteiniphilum sp.]|jgi:cell division protein FtsL|nr:FtsL-like putative cell division protein [Proteiniphilum sp.]MDD4158070.1 FtsL-like putative cell division protein [Proteiniphilum sp.]MDD4800777.1 FtsL-like putative cell division protein [Proteiniphilum sp.]